MDYFADLVEPLPEDFNLEEFLNLTENYSSLMEIYQMGHFEPRIRYMYFCLLCRSHFDAIDICAYHLRMTHNIVKNEIEDLADKMNKMFMYQRNGQDSSTDDTASEHSNATGESSEHVDKSNEQDAQDTIVGTNDDRTEDIEVEEYQVVGLWVSFKQDFGKYLFFRGFKCKFCGGVTYPEAGCINHLKNQHDIETKREVSYTDHKSWWNYFNFVGPLFQLYLKNAEKDDGEQCSKRFLKEFQFLKDAEESFYGKQWPFSDYG